MGKITRFVQKIFGYNLEATPSTGLAQFGSLANGSPTFTADPTTIQQLPAWDNGWAGAFIPGSRQSPAFEDFNGLLNVITKQLAYILQTGVPEWNDATTYYIGSMVNANNSIYVSQLDDNLNVDVSNTSYWRPLIKPQLTAKAWANFDGSGVIRSSFNVTSVVRNSTGNYTINFTGSFPDSNFCSIISCGDYNTTNADFAQEVSRTNSSVTIQDRTTFTGRADSPRNNIVIFALTDLA